MDTMSLFVVRFADGSVDVEGTCDKFRSDLEAHIALRETEEAEIGEAVSAVFDANPGVRMNVPAVITFALVRLGASAANHKVLSERIAEHLRARAQGDTLPDGSVQNPDSEFVIQRGRNGGCWRRADVPAK